MKAADVMTLGAATVQPGDTVAHAARKMLQYAVSGLPVVDGDGRLVGIVTERDFLRRTELGTERTRPRWAEFLFGTAELADDYVRSHARKVEEVMTHDVVTVEDDTPLSEVVNLMERRDFKRLPVVRDGRVIGILSRANLLRAVARVPDESAGEAVDDRVIRDRIIDEIDKQPWAPQGALDISVRQGIVTLRGALGDESVRRAVRVAAENAPGVREVNDQILVIQDVSGWV